jgi:hypothetical protein
VDFGVNAVTSTAGVALRDANSITFNPALPTSVDNQQIPVLGLITTSNRLFELKAQQSHAVRVKSWGITVGGMPNENLRLTVNAGTSSGPPSPPDPYLSGHEVKNHQDTFFILQAGQSLVLEASMINDELGPGLVDFGICYWTFPVSRRVDSREETRLRDGYGCK